MNVTIRPITTDDAESFHSCLDIVAREAKYLAMLEAPPIDQTRAFVNDNIANGYPQLVAHDGARVVGWCDILPGQRVTMRHCGTLGLGLLPEHRGKGLGRELIAACIAKAPDVGVTRIQLDVRADNERALRLYERMGFVRDGIKKNGMRVNGEYFELITMALLLEQVDPQHARGIRIPVRDGLELRQRLPEDAEELFALTDRNRAYLRQWLPWLDYCTSPADTRKNVEASLRDAEEGIGLAVCIWHQGRIVGVTGYNEIHKDNRVGHVGYWLGEEHLGKGIMTASVRALVEYGFRELRLNRQTIAAATDNLRSRALAERLGFQLEGIAHEAEWLYDRFVDHAVYALLSKDQEIAGRTTAHKHPACAITYQLDPNADWVVLTDAVSKGIWGADPQDVWPRDWQTISIALRDSEGAVVGGLYGATIWSWLMIDGLWVAPELGGQGLGRRLLLASEELAIQRGCIGSWLGTFDFQAKVFYERHGYSVFAELAGFPPNHTHFHLRKHFSASQS